MGSDTKLDGAGDNADRNRSESGLLETEAWWRCLVAHSSLDRAGAAQAQAHQLVWELGLRASSSRL